MMRSNNSQIAIVQPSNDKPRTLWIDAVGVDQLDMQERGSQVKRMADIYKNASRVVVWLGLGTQESAQAVQTLRSIASKVIVS
jgi:anaerobic selenocysteine-containing dehydrogenase